MSQPPRRHGRGFRQAAQLVAAPIRHAAEGRGFAVARLLTHWPEIAGPEIAPRARPVRIAHSRSGFGATLTLLTTGASAPLIEMWLPALRERVNACYGYNAIARIQVTQTAPTGFAEAQAQFSAAPAPGPAARLPDARTRCEAESLAANVTDPALRAALTRLAMLKLTREGKPNRKAP